MSSFARWSPWSRQSYPVASPGRTRSRESGPDSSRATATRLSLTRYVLGSPERFTFYHSSSSCASERLAVVAAAVVLVVAASAAAAAAAADDE